jgi:hypothetical protein
MELRADKDKVDNEITAINTDIKNKEEKLEKERRGEKNQDIINDLKESITALRTEKALLIAERKELQHDIATQSNQGKFTHCQHVVMSRRRPIPKLICRLFVKVCVECGTDSLRRTFPPKLHLSTSSARLVVRKGCFMKAIFPEGCLLG